MNFPANRILKTINNRIKFSKLKSKKSKFGGSIFLSDANDKRNRLYDNANSQYLFCDLKKF